MRTVKLLTAALIATFALAGCKELEDSTREQGAKEQEAVMERAVAKNPTYQPQNFITRATVNKWMRRMDQPEKTFYVYVLGDNGQKIGYYVSQTRPISTCTFLTPPDRLVGGDRGQSHGDFVVQAPALDGAYYGSGGCDSKYFFDASTDAYVEVDDFKLLVSDTPLRVDADPLGVTTIEDVEGGN